jgi:ABC-type Fe2+-enterobactin transport system substrate-binding protein
MSKRLVTNPKEIYEAILADPVMTEAVSMKNNKVYVMGSDGTSRQITQIELVDDEL